MLRLNLFIRLSICFLFVFLPLRNLDEWVYDLYFKQRGPQPLKDSPYLLVNCQNPSEAEILSRSLENSPPKAIGIVQALLPLADSFSGSKIIEGTIEFSGLVPDSDGVFRKATLSDGTNLSLTAKLYQKVSSTPLHRDLEKPLYINFVGPAETIPTLKAVEFLKSFQTLDLQNKIVLLGADFALSNSLITPMGKMSRLEIQANLLNTLLNSNEIKPFPNWVRYLVALVCLCISVVLILFLPLKLGWVSLLTFSAMVYLSGLGSFCIFHRWLEISNAICCIFGTHLLMLGYKLSLEEEKNWRQQQKASNQREIDEFKNNFISLFSHDLKTPLAQLNALTSQLEEEKKSLPPKIQENIQLIHKTSTLLQRSISNILKVTRFESTPLKTQKEVIDFNRLAETAVADLQLMAKEKGIELILDLEPLFSLEADSKLLLEVMHNLVENAIKYSPNHKRVIIRTQEADEKISFVVIDEGIGIPPEEIPKITQKFYRAKSADKSAKGSGLGLYLCKYFIEAHKGKLSIRSEEGRTEIGFWLPAT